MKNKIKKICIVLFIVFVCLVPIFHPEADSGFGGSYSSNSSSSSNGSLGSVASENPILILIAFGFALVVGIVCFIDEHDQGPTTKLKNVPPYDPEKLKEYLPDFDPFEFKNQTFEIYKKIQIAWMNFDYDSMRKCVTDEMFNMYKSQLTTLSVKKQTNVMKDFNLLGFNIVGMEVKDNTVSLTVTMGVECYDYITDKNNKVVRGTDKRKVIYNYAMTFNKGISNKPNKCPNCGASLENVNSSVCPYCDSTIIGENYDWILAKKQVLSQRYK